MSSGAQRSLPGAVRLAEVIGSLSLAIDLGLGQPMEQVVRTCLLTVRLGEALALPEDELIEAYYLALLSHVGCTAESSLAAAATGDDVESHAVLLAALYGQPTDVLLALARHLGHGRPVVARVRQVATALARVPRVFQQVTTAHCEAARLLVDQLGLGAMLREAVGQTYERWDGSGTPRRLKGEQIRRSTRLVQVAGDAVLLDRLGGPAEAIAGVTRHAATAHDPTIVTRFRQIAEPLLASLDEPSAWEAVLAAEPGERPYLAGVSLDTALLALADFADLKSAYLTGHSRGVAALAAAAAAQHHLAPGDVDLVRRAGLVHDVGRVGVSSAIWEKPGPLTDDEWERVRLHPYYGERVLTRAPGLVAIGGLATLHHERLDGTGYYRRLSATHLPLTARLLAAADVYQAVTQERPHRPAMTTEQAADVLRHEVRTGRLDSEAVVAVLSAAGHRVHRRRPPRVAGLSEREVEVLGLLARGYANRRIATTLAISERTVHHHVEHIYDKLGLSTRAAATLFAVQHQLVTETETETHA